MISRVIQDLKNVDRWVRKPSRGKTLMKILSDQFHHCWADPQLYCSVAMPKSWVNTSPVWLNGLWMLQMWPRKWALILIIKKRIKNCFYPHSLLLKKPGKDQLFSWWELLIWMLIFLKWLVHEQNNYIIISLGTSAHPSDKITCLTNLEILYNTGLNWKKNS